MPEPSTSLKSAVIYQAILDELSPLKPQPIEMAMIKTITFATCDFIRHLIPAAIIIANIIKPAPPNTGNGIDKNKCTEYRE